MTGKRVNPGDPVLVGHAAKIIVKVADDSGRAEAVIVLSDGVTRPQHHLLRVVSYSSY